MEHHRRDARQLSDVPELSGHEPVPGVSAGESRLHPSVSMVMKMSQAARYSSELILKLN